MDLFDISGQKLRETRDRLGWSRDFLCEKSGVPVRTIQDIENGTVQNPGVETVKRLIEAMLPNQGSALQRAESTLALIALLPSLNNDEIEGLLSVARSSASQFASAKRTAR